jgi:predicted PurR-regulated permease PerM
MSLGEWIVLIGVGVLVVAAFIGIWQVRNSLMLIFLAVIVALALQGPIHRFERMGLPRGLALLLTLVLVLIIGAVLGVLLVSTFVEQMQQLIDQLPDTFDTVRAEYDRISSQYGVLPEVDWDALLEGEGASWLSQQLSSLPGNIFPFVSGVGGLIANILFIFIIALFFVVDPTNYLDGALTLVPQGYRPRALEILVHLAGTLRAWFVGQLISMLTLGTMITFVNAVLINIPNPVALGVLAGIMEFVPNIGSIISIVPALLVGLADDPAKVPLVLIGYIVTQQIQSNLIMPRIMTRQINMPAGVVLSAQLVAASLFGFIGLLLALPLAVLVKVLVRELYVYDVLNSRTARVLTQRRADGRVTAVVVSEPYRPEQLSPGEAARLQAEGFDPFAASVGQTVEIVTPPSPALERAARGQQAVWVAVFTLVVAQALALVRSVLVGERRSG